MRFEAHIFFQFVQKFYLNNESPSMLGNEAVSFILQYYATQGKFFENEPAETEFNEFLDQLVFLRKLHATTLSLDQSQALKKRFFYCAGIAAVQVPISCDIVRTLLKDFDGLCNNLELQQKDILERFIHKLNRILFNIERDCNGLYSVMHDLGDHNLLKEAVEFKGYD